MLSPFHYHRPQDFQEALSLLRQSPEAKPLAGGTDLLVKMRRGKLQPPSVVDIKDLEECRGIAWENDHLSVGALTTFQELLQAQAIREHYSVLFQAAQAMGCYEIRRRATLGGNVANASPGAESGSPLAVLEAQVELAGVDGRRRLPVTEFWRGAGETVLESGELLTRILIPALPSGSRSTYLRRSRVRGMDLAAVNVAVVMIHPQATHERQVRIAMGAVAPTPVRAKGVEEMLAGQEIDDRLLSRMRQAIRAGLNPRATSLRATPEYKKEMVGVLTQMALECLLNQ